MFNWIQPGHLDISPDKCIPEVALQEAIERMAEEDLS